MVHRLEPKFHNRDWIGDLAPGVKKILFYDNNWLAKSVDDLRHDITLIRGLVKMGHITSVDFNQALDCRLLTGEKANMLQGLPIKPVRFSFDGMHEDGHCQRAVRMMAARGYRDIMWFILYNYLDTPQDFYYRMRQAIELSDELGIDVYTFPMRYQPILDADAGRDYVGKHWTEAQKKGFMAILSLQSLTGQVSAKMDEFEFWFGKDADEFDRLLSYPKIRELAQRKKGALRMERARAK